MHPALGPARRGHPHRAAERHHPPLRRRLLRLVGKLDAGRFAHELRLAHELADIADAITLPAFRARLEVTTKADGSPVTAADLDAERAMRVAIRTRFPGHAILGEEDGLDGPDAASRWVLDPIDGTVNFARGLPVFATLIAHEVDGVGQVGVVSAPALGSRWEAVRGVGASRDGSPIRVAPTAQLADAHLSLGSLWRFDDRGLRPAVDGLIAQVARQRGFGDFWHHCLVASGALDVAIEPEVSVWDLAAVKVLVEAAGGRLTSLAGEDTTEAGDAVSSNGLVHDQVLAILRAG